MTLAVCSARTQGLVSTASVVQSRRPSARLISVSLRSCASAGDEKHAATAAAVPAASTSAAVTNASCPSAPELTTQLTSRSWSSIDAPETLTANVTVPVVVVDSASTDDTTAVARQAGVEVVRCDRPGASVARNAGWQAARHEIVAYLV